MYIVSSNVAKTLSKILMAPCLNTVKVTSALTAWDAEWTKHYITYLAKVLHLYTINEDIRLLACSSYACELFFAHLRYNSNFKNTLP